MVAMNISVGSKWVPVKGVNNLHWTVTKQFTAEDGESVYRIEKIYGGRNSPGLITGKRLKANFTQKHEHTD